MDYLQYYQMSKIYDNMDDLSFKPYYKWITFNTDFLDRNPTSSQKEF